MDKIFNEDVRTTLNILMEYVREASKEYGNKDLLVALNVNGLPQFITDLITKGESFNLLYNDKDEAYRLYGVKNGEWQYVSTKTLNGNAKYDASMCRLIKDNFDGLRIEISDGVNGWTVELNVKNNEILKIKYERDNKPGQVIEVVTNRELTEMYVEFSKANKPNYADAYYMAIDEEDSEVLLNVAMNNFGLPSGETLPF